MNVMSRPTLVKAVRSPATNQITIEKTELYDEESARANWGDEYIDELIAAI